MKLYLKDRFTLNALLNTIPKEGGFLQMMNIAAMANKLEITPDDQVKCDMKEVEGGGIQWDFRKDEGIEINFTAPQLEIIRNGIKAIPADTIIKEDDAYTYLKFIDINDIQP